MPKRSLKSTEERSHTPFSTDVADTVKQLLRIQALTPEIEDALATLQSQQQQLEPAELIFSLKHKTSKAQATKSKITKDFDLMYSKWETKIMKNKKQKGNKQPARIFALADESSFFLACEMAYVRYKFNEHSELSKQLNTIAEVGRSALEELLKKKKNSMDLYADFYLRYYCFFLVLQDSSLEYLKKKILQSKDGEALELMSTQVLESIHSWLSTAFFKQLPPDLFNSAVTITLQLVMQLHALFNNSLDKELTKDVFDLLTEQLQHPSQSAIASTVEFIKEFQAKSVETVLLLASRAAEVSAELLMQLGTSTAKALEQYSEEEPVEYLLSLMQILRRIPETSTLSVGVKQCMRYEDHDDETLRCECQLMMIEYFCRLESSSQFMEVAFETIIEHVCGDVSHRVIECSLRRLRQVSSAELWLERKVFIPKLLAACLEVIRHVHGAVHLAVELVMEIVKDNPFCYTLATSIDEMDTVGIAFKAQVYAIMDDLICYLHACEPDDTAIPVISDLLVSKHPILKTVDINWQLCAELGKGRKQWLQTLAAAFAIRFNEGSLAVSAPVDDLQLFENIAAHAKKAKLIKREQEIIDDYISRFLLSIDQVVLERNEAAALEIARLAQILTLAERCFAKSVQKHFIRIYKAVNKIAEFSLITYSMQIIKSAFKCCMSLLLELVQGESEEEKIDFATNCTRMYPTFACCANFLKENSEPDPIFVQVLAMSLKGIQHLYSLISDLMVNENGENGTINRLLAICTTLVACEKSPLFSLIQGSWKTGFLSNIREAVMNTIIPSVQSYLSEQSVASSADIQTMVQVLSLLDAETDYEVDVLSLLTTVQLKTESVPPALLESLLKSTSKYCTLSNRMASFDSLLLDLLCAYTHSPSYCHVILCYLADRIAAKSEVINEHMLADSEKTQGLLASLVNSEQEVFYHTCAVLGLLLKNIHDKEPSVVITKLLILQKVDNRIIGLVLNHSALSTVRNHLQIHTLEQALDLQSLDILQLVTVWSAVDESFQQTWFQLVREKKGKLALLVKSLQRKKEEPLELKRLCFEINAKIPGSNQIGNQQAIHALFGTKTQIASGTKPKQPRPQENDGFELEPF